MMEALVYFAVTCLPLGQKTAQQLDRQYVTKIYAMQISGKKFNVI